MRYQRYDGVAVAAAKAGLSTTTEYRLEKGAISAADAQTFTGQASARPAR